MNSSSLGPVENGSLMRGVVVCCRITSELITLSGKRIPWFVCVLFALRFFVEEKKGGRGGF